MNKTQSQQKVGRGAEATLAHNLHGTWHNHNLYV